MSPSEEKLQTFLDLKNPRCGMAAQMKKFSPGIMLTFPLLQKISSHSAVFTWKDTIQAELDNLKKALMESVRLSPLDVNKRIFCFTNSAVTCGMCYLLETVQLCSYLRMLGRPSWRSYTAPTCL